jgi:site-specific DNA-methyltransferase (adenine-specific)
MTEKQRAPNNRTIVLSSEEEARMAAHCRSAGDRTAAFSPGELAGAVFLEDFFTLRPLLPEEWVDLLFFDPPYNLDKRYADSSFSRRDEEEYERYLAAWLDALLPMLRPAASLYLCSDWRSSATVQRALEKRFVLRNRIVWEREKGRAARNNWKNTAEDIWFATVSDDYFFDPQAVKLKRRVRAPYRRSDGSPKDWRSEESGKFRLTAPSNLWSDITVPYWSMRENTDHPAQKPEKLLAKLILASSRPGDLVLDPCAGSGSSAVTAKKLGRRYTAVEREPEYAALTRKRLELAEEDPAIQGYDRGVFWERNSGP